MYFHIKHLLFIFIFSALYCFVGYKFFYSIFIANSVIIPYGIHPFDICIKNPDLWIYIKLAFIITYVFSSFIISNSVFRFLCTFLLKLANIIHNIFSKVKKFAIFSKLVNIFKKFTNFIIKRKQINRNNYTFFSSKEANGILLSNQKKSSNSKLLKPLQLFVGNSVANKLPIYLPSASLYQNILVTGTIGTGKTSSAMYPFTKQLIEYCSNDAQNKIGMLVLDVKGNYYLKVAEFAKQFNRENDLIVISLSGKYKYNPLHKPNLKPTVLANRLKTILLLFSPNNSESYWLDKVEQILAECIKLCRLYNDGYVTFEEIHKLVSIENYYAEKIEYLRKKFLNNEFSREDTYNLLSSLNFFQKEFLSLDQRTLSILKSEITRITNVFVSDYEVYKTFNPPKEELNFYGFEDLINTGKIVVLNMNISEYKVLSKIIATYLKLDFQTEVMARLANNFANSSRTVAFISDEYHEYCTSSDSEFYAQSREAKCINIVATQSYTSLLNTLNNKYAVDVIVQNLVNKFWFRTDDIFTIENAQKQIGKEDKERLFTSISENAKETNYSYVTNTLNSVDSNISESISTQVVNDFVYDTNFFTQDLENFCALSFLSDGNKIMKPEKIRLKPYFEK